MSRRWRPSLALVLGGALAATLDSTARRVIAMAGALRDRETTVRAYSDHVTHELKTPVAAIRAGVELIEDGGTLAPQDREVLARIASAGCQIEAQLAALREMARARETRYIGESTLVRVLPGLQADWPAVRVQAVGADIRLAIAPEGLRLVLGHLIRNSADEGADQVEILAETGGETGQLTVTDNGQGISPGNAARVFEPFFTTRRESGGTGMGLAVVRAILTAHGGSIALAEGKAGRGAAFLLTLPPGRD